jgi:hypothetical protein
MVNVLRFKGGNDLAGLVDKAGSHNKRFDIHGEADDAQGGGEIFEAEQELEVASK